MAIEVFNRHECKYLIDSVIYPQIEARLLEHMRLDEFNKSHGFYSICNIYYDTKDNQVIRNSISKPVYKEKLRLRSYGVPEGNDQVYLEIKKKVIGLVNKRRTKIGLEEAYEFLKTSERPKIKSYMNKQVVNEIEHILAKQQLEPKLFLAYDRKAFHGTNDRSLRVTFDVNIRTRRYDLRLENGDYGERLSENNKILMELKVEKSIPLWMSKLLSEYKIYSTSFSKYGKEYEKMLLREREMKGDTNICLKPYQATYSIQPQAAQQCL